MRVGDYRAIYYITSEAPRRKQRGFSEKEGVDLTHSSPPQAVGHPARSREQVNVVAVIHRKDLEKEISKLNLR